MDDPQDKSTNCSNPFVAEEERSYAHSHISMAGNNKEENYSKLLVVLGSGIR